MTELQKQASTELTIAENQSNFTPAQKTALAHMGVEDATEDDLKVFFHQVKRTGLDPFARQIHMIGRNAFNPKTNSWGVKYTIQTGIDGYRLIGRRAADQSQDTISVEPPEWLHNDGTWRPAWSKQWGMPLAARVTLKRAGQPFTAVAMMDEYQQTKKDGNLTQMWAQRPAGQLAKCAEALAWRMAFPQDLAGLYTHEEMAQADNPEPTTTQHGHDKPVDHDALISERWDDRDALAQLGTWASQQGWPEDKIQQIRDRWNALAPEETTEPLQGEIINEPQD